MSLIKVIQDIAVKAVLANQPAEFCTGTVLQESPLKIILSGETQLVLTEECLVLTEPVIEKTLTIKKHTHKLGEFGFHVHDASGLEVTDPNEKTLGKVGKTKTPAPTSEPKKEVFGQIISSYSDETEIVNTVVDAYCTEHKTKLPVDKSDDEIIITLNRKLEKDDKVIMLAVENGQTYVILSRVFDHISN